MVPGLWRAYGLCRPAAPALPHLPGPADLPGGKRLAHDPAPACPGRRGLFPGSARGRRGALLPARVGGVRPRVGGGPVCCRLPGAVRLAGRPGPAAAPGGGAPGPGGVRRAGGGPGPGPEGPPVPRPAHQLCDPHRAGAARNRAPEGAAPGADAASLSPRAGPHRPPRPLAPEPHDYGAGLPLLEPHPLGGLLLHPAGHGAGLRPEGAGAAQRGGPAGLRPHPGGAGQRPAGVGRGDLLRGVRRLGAGARSRPVGAPGRRGGLRPQGHPRVDAGDCSGGLPHAGRALGQGAAGGHIAGDGSAGRLGAGGPGTDLG